MGGTCVKGALIARRVKTVAIVIDVRFNSVEPGDRASGVSGSCSGIDVMDLRRDKLSESTRREGATYKLEELVDDNLMALKLRNGVHGCWVEGR